MVPVRLSNGDRWVDVIAFLDEGASYSLMERDVADYIQLEGVPQPLLVKWTVDRLKLPTHLKARFFFGKII